MSGSRREEVVEEVEWLLSYRVVPQEIARRLGYSSTASLCRALNKYGEHELANTLYRKQVTYSEWDQDAA